ncbi:MAG: hypothetical protein JW794_06030 [Candidatus Cloacimonetes bacterium]|nr:hypothetical protein [Candidatus Cloacimonadota bacterium]
MSLIRCPECNNKISEYAQNCPRCGYILTPEIIKDIKKRDKKIQRDKGIGCLAFILLLVILVLISHYRGRDTVIQKPKSDAQLRKERIEKQFNSWDGSHNELTNYIKNNMNDPKSYEHIETVYSDHGDYLIVITSFRGKNVFGGIVKNSIKAKVDIDGKILEIIAKIP